MANFNLDYSTSNICPWEQLWPNGLESWTCYCAGSSLVAGWIVWWGGVNVPLFHLQYHDWGETLEARHRTPNCIGCPLLWVCVHGVVCHYCVCVYLDGLNAEQQIPSMGHHLLQSKVLKNISNRAGGWLYQILNYIIGRSSLKLFIIGLILNLQFHGGWLKLTRLKPNRLQDILFTGTGKKCDNCKFGPVVANSIKIWKTVERRIGGPFKFCNSTPLWHNLNFVCGNRPFVKPSWSSLGVNTCGDIW